MTNPTAAFYKGDAVRITKGAHGDRIGTVTNVNRHTGTATVSFFGVRLYDGTEQHYSLPFAPVELELYNAADIPAGPGRHRRLALPRLLNQDTGSQARCTGHAGVKGLCPRHDAANYPRHAKHRTEGVAAA